MDFVESLQPKERAILVGHSMGGLGLSIAMEKFPNKVSAAVFVTAHMPGPHLRDYNKREYTKSGFFYGFRIYIYDQGPNNPPTAVKFGPNMLASKLYQLSPPKDLALAISLLRPYPIFNDEELVLEQTKLSKGKYGSVRRVFIICDQDHAIDEGLQRYMIEQNPPNEVKVINGTDHMVMFTRPLKLFSFLGEIAEKYY
ncbi:hypothetical protein L484_020274 [Morus notabilis]|uniref:AB hydrolase-1 domain-containing protein n=2 Tax=Morus notabilis TaxID=981085 RepID=W9R2Y0_9ROSA|nr:hypothetical protein L484_020274 [Morus notabilis]